MKIALIGNPNVGKTTIYNILTNSQEKIGNYPGVTVDIKSKNILEKNIQYTIIDFPGIYSLFPKSKDEKLSYESLTNNSSKFYPDIIFFIFDWNNIRRGLFLYRQVYNLYFPTIVLINKIHKSKIILKKNQQKVAQNFMNFYGHDVYFIQNKKTQELKQIFNNIESIIAPKKNVFKFPQNYNYLKQYIQKKENIYLFWLELAQVDNSFKSNKHQLIIKNHKITAQRLQVLETLQYNKKNNEFLEKLKPLIKNSTEQITKKIDKFILHPVLGYFIFFVLLFIIFQFLLNFSYYPMRIIENIVNITSIILKNNLPKSPLTSLFINGIISGVGNILVFIPQIIFLFFSVLFLEQTGYLSRVIFLMDRIMRPFGLNGKSIIPLISGTVCAIPAIISTRNIENSNERILTILVTPFINCSARLPIYSVLIILVIPRMYYFGINLQGLVLMGIYLLGIIMALLSALILKKFKVKKKELIHQLIIEMPNYRFPKMNNILLEAIKQCKEFIFGAGKIIFTVSIILWGLSSFSPKSKLKNWVPPKIEESFLGIAGKYIEPIIRPIGFDWKIGISIITSIAAREVFVGTLKSIYSLEEFSDSIIHIKFYELIKYELFNFKEDSSNSLIFNMQNDTFSDTGKPIYNLASGCSLMIFYAFSMQCIATIAVIKKELNSWKLAFFQFLSMTFLAYICSWLVYSIFI